MINSAFSTQFSKIVNRTMIGGMLSGN